MSKLLLKIEERLAMFFFSATTILVLIGAISRQMDTPLTWSMDFAQLTFIWTCVLSADVTLKENGHIVIDILTKYIPAPVQRFLDTLWQVAIVAFLCMLIWYGYELVISNLVRKIGDTDLSYGWVTVAIPVGAVLMLITTLTQLWQRITELLTTKQTGSQT